MRDGDTILSSAQLCQQIGMSRRTLWRWIAGKKFPKPDIAIGRKHRRWRESTINKWREGK